MTGCHWNPWILMESGDLNSEIRGFRFWNQQIFDFELTDWMNNISWKLHTWGSGLSSSTFFQTKDQKSTLVWLLVCNMYWPNPQYNRNHVSQTITNLVNLWYLMSLLFIPLLDSSIFLSWWTRLLKALFTPSLTCSPFRVSFQISSGVKSLKHIC